jgi:hypothetical protein
MKQQLVSKHQGKLSKGILFHQDNAVPHKAAIMHLKLTDLHFEVLKHPTYSPGLAFFLTLRDESFRALRRPH